MKKTVYRIFLLLSVLGLLFSAFMVVRYKIEENRITKSLPQVLQTIENMLPTRTNGFFEEYYDSSLASVSLNGDDFVGILEVELYGVKLPVFGEWSKTDAKRPAVYWGNPYDGSLIIGVNYDGQFEFADRMETGEVIRFTDLYGQVFSYTVDAIKHADKAEYSVLQSVEDDLTIFLKVKSSYLILRCSIR